MALDGHCLMRGNNNQPKVGVGSGRGVGEETMKVHRGKVNKYLGMSLDFSHKGQVFVTMHDHLDGITKTYDPAKDKHDDGFLPITKQCNEASL